LHYGSGTHYYNHDMMHVMLHDYDHMRLYDGKRRCSLNYDHCDPIQLHHRYQRMASIRSDLSMYTQYG